MFKKREIRGAEMMGFLLSLLSPTLPLLLIWSNIVDKSRISTLTHNE